MASKLTIALFILAGLVAMATCRIHYGTWVRHGYDDESQQNFREYLSRRSCIPLGESGCEGNNGKCCREGDPYTGTMRKCVNEGSFSSPNYKCLAA